MITKFRKIKKRTPTNYFLAAIILVFVFLAIGFLLISNIKVRQERKNLDSQVASLKKQIEELQKKNEEIKKGISEAGQEEYIEKIAREELNLQKEGEKVVGFILPEAQPEKKEEKSFWNFNKWWEKIRRFFNF